MTDLTNISDFSYTNGLNLGSSNQSFTYLYGLSDFWQYIFQDTTTTNLLLEATSLQASDIYSKFLQLSAGISIEDISAAANSQLRLEIINATNTYGVAIDIMAASWTAGTTSLTLANVNGLAAGDVISVSNVGNITVYDMGNGIDFYPMDSGGPTTIVSGTLWNGTFSVSTVSSITNTITYSQPTDPGAYTSGGTVGVTSIGYNTYYLNDTTLSARFITNRPFLPTITLEENIDYSIDYINFRISFAQPLSTYGFPVRQDTGGNNEYSLWFVDVRYDEPLIYSNFPLLIGRYANNVPSVQYRDFLYGLYYIYTSGPTLSVIEKGLNLVLGVPLARGNETVLEIIPYLNTTQYVVITDSNSYILPTGLHYSTAISVGTVLNAGDEIAKWVTIVDGYSQRTSTPPGGVLANGSVLGMNGTVSTATAATTPWWNTYSVEVPPTILPNVPAGMTRLMSDPNTNWLMNTYLGIHTFLVIVNTSSLTFNQLQEFESITSILEELKPNHTYPIYYYASYIYPTPVFTKGVAGNLVAAPPLSQVTSYSNVGTMISGLLLGGLSSPTTVGAVSAIESFNILGNTAVGSLGGIQISKPITFNTATGSTGSLTSSTLIPGLLLGLSANTNSGVLSPSVKTGANITTTILGNSSSFLPGVI